ncbi:MAG: ThiF family adenylyltransferase [Acidimicrobiia bacterium]
MERSEREQTPAQVDVAAFAAIVDLREGDDLIDRIPGAVQRSRTDLAAIGQLVPDPESPILVYCGVGEQSRSVVGVLSDLGFSNVVSLAGGIRRWRSEGLPLIKTDSATADRYDRHIRLDGIGESGQQRVRTARVAVVGTGGLGSPAIQYLASAGVGALAIIDGDRVDPTNLQRQVLFDKNDLGLRKADAARERVREINTDVEVTSMPTWLDADNAADLLTGHDLLVDASDNFGTRLAVNDTAVDLGIPFVHGAAIRWEGMVAAFDPRVGPCYRCLFPGLPEHEETCGDVGVLGAVTGVIGSLMAVEAIKHLVGSPDRTIDQLVTYDARSSRFASLRIERSNSCPVQS